MDGNGRTGRLLTTFYLCKIGVLERPVLYLSEYFLNNQQAYYDSLDEYHSDSGTVFTWLDFFLDGVAIIADEAIKTSKDKYPKTKRHRENSNAWSKGKMGNVVLENLYKVPIVSVRKIEDWTGLSRVGK